MTLASVPPGPNVDAGRVPATPVHVCFTNAPARPELPHSAYISSFEPTRRLRLATSPCNGAPAATSRPPLNTHRARTEERFRPMRF